MLQEERRLLAELQGARPGRQATLESSMMTRLDQLEQMIRDKHERLVALRTGKRPPELRASAETRPTPAAPLFGSSDLPMPAHAPRWSRSHHATTVAPSVMPAAAPETPDEEAPEGRVLVPEERPQTPSTLSSISSLSPSPPLDGSLRDTPSPPPFAFQPLANDPSPAAEPPAQPAAYASPPPPPARPDADSARVAHALERAQAEQERRRRQRANVDRARQTSPMAAQTLHDHAQTIAREVERQSHDTIERLRQERQNARQVGDFCLVDPHVSSSSPSLFFLCFLGQAVEEEDRMAAAVRKAREALERQQLQAERALQESRRQQEEAAALAQQEQERQQAAERARHRAEQDLMRVQRARIEESLRQAPRASSSEQALDALDRAAVLHATPDVAPRPLAAPLAASPSPPPEDDPSQRVSALLQSLMLDEPPLGADLRDRVCLECGHDNLLLATECEACHVPFARSAPPPTAAEPAPQPQPASLPQPPRPPRTPSPRPLPQAAEPERASPEPKLAASPTKLPRPTPPTSARPPSSRPRTGRSTATRRASQPAKDPGART